MHPWAEPDKPQSHCWSNTTWLPHSKAEFPTETSRTPPFTTTQFHVLLNSLFKVLFNLPSPYLFAIGLGVIFRLTRSLPRTLGCTPKQPDSREKSPQSAGSLTGLSPSMGCGHCQVGLWLVSVLWKRSFQTLHSAWPEWPAVQRWANPVSLAVTKGITVVFFSSAY